jgi:hypothetical protein
VHRTNSAPCCHEGRASEGRWSRSRSPECAPANCRAPPGTCPHSPERTHRAREFKVPGGSLRLFEVQGKGLRHWNRGIAEPGQEVHNPPNREFVPRPRPECAPVTLPQDAPCALNFHGGRGHRPERTGSVFGQVGEARAGPRTLRTGSAERSADAQSGRRSSPPGPVRRPRGCRRRCPPAHWIQYSGPTHAESMEALPPWPEKSARTGARPHVGGTSQRCVHPQNFRTDHNPAIRNNAP